MTMPVAAQHTMRRARRAFSFVEVLFATIILGIGFIMVAAIFPVALQQSKLTVNETTGASIARGTANTMARAMSDSAGDTTGTHVASVANTNAIFLQEGGLPTMQFPIVQQLSYLNPTALPSHSLWNSLRGDLILPEDPRYASVTLYRRGGTAIPGAGSPQIYVFSVQATATPIFSVDIDAHELTAAAGAYNSEANLMAHAVRVCIRHNVQSLGGIDLIAFDTSAGLTQNQIPNVQAAVEGGYVVIAQDHLSANNAGRMDGSIYKLGARRADLDADIYAMDAANPPTLPFPKNYFNTLKTGIVFELDPGTPFVPDAGVDGIARHYKTGQTSLDDIVGLGNTSALDNYVANSTSDSTLVDVAGFTPVGLSTADAFVVGRSFTTPADQTNGYSGGNMVIGCYTTFVNMN